MGVGEHWPMRSLENGMISYAESIVVRAPFAVGSAGNRDSKSTVSALGPLESTQIGVFAGA